MRRFSVTGLLILALGIVLQACAGVIIPYPVGEPVSDEVGKQLEGWWTGDDEAYAVSYLAAGAIRITGISEEGGEVYHDELTALLTTYENALYLNVRLAGPEPDASPEYLLFRVKPGGGRVLVLWVPRIGTFADAVRSGELAGEVIQSPDVKKVTIAASKAELQAFLKSRTPGDLFELEEPLVFVGQAAK